MTAQLRPHGYRLRWRKNPPETGLRRVFARPLGHKLFDANGTQFASVDFTDRNGLCGWYFVAGWGAGDLGLVKHKNTCETPHASPNDAKAAALAYVRACLKETLP